MDKNAVKRILKDLNLHPRKSLGQNFLVNKKTLSKILSESSISSEDIILEVGPGLGILTSQLINQAKKVIAIEIDETLFEYLNTKFNDIQNLDLIKGDILEIDLPAHNKVVSNIPYSITGPLFEKLFFKKNAPEGILTIEKNIADRILYKDNYKNFSRITVSVNSFMEPVRHTTISKGAFYPRPKIDLSLLHLLPKKDLDPLLYDNDFRTFYLAYIAGIMPYKNKNIANAIHLFTKRYKDKPLNKEIIRQILEKKGMKNQKVFELKIDQFVDLGKAIFEICDLKE